MRSRSFSTGCDGVPHRIVEPAQRVQATRSAGPKCAIVATRLIRTTGEPALDFTSRLQCLQKDGRAGKFDWVPTLVVPRVVRSLYPRTGSATATAVNESSVPDSVDVK